MRYLIPFIGLLFAACSNGDVTSTVEISNEDASVEPADSGPKLEKLWLAEGFSDPEGVAPAPGGGYFISNVSGEGDARDSVGWISRLSSDGELVEERWVEGLDAPKGMAIRDGVLYVADIDRVRLYDVATGALGGEVTIADAKFLNDVTVWKGNVLVSDSGGARIYSITENGAETWLESKEMLGGVNGLLANGERLLISTMDAGSLLETTGDGELHTLAGDMIDADGIGLVPGGGYLVSAWPGDIFFVSPDGETTKLVDTRGEGTYQNDLTIFGDTVIVPNWKPGTVTAWRITR